MQDIIQKKISTRARNLIETKRNYGYITEKRCWLVGEGKDKNYQSAKFFGKYKGLHVISAIGYLGLNYDTNLWVCHKCDVKGCFNPAHLFIGTIADNVNDAVKKGIISKSLRKFYATRYSERIGISEGDGGDTEALIRDYTTKGRTSIRTRTRTE